jgi:hypothetical protein
VRRSWGERLYLPFVKSARASVGYLYLNNDVLPNPWNGVPPYCSDLLAALEDLAARLPFTTNG